jgi:hypothetical protein
MNDANLKPWPKGTSGNPAGRPPGTRQAFSAAFMRDLAEVWAQEGRQTVISTAKTNPSTFFAVCARLIPTDVKLTVEQTFGGLSAEDYAVLQAIKEAIPDASSRSPAEVLQYTLDALRQADAKVIEADENDYSSDSRYRGGIDLTQFFGPARWRAVHRFSDSCPEAAPTAWPAGAGGAAGTGEPRRTWDQTQLPRQFNRKTDHETLSPVPIRLRQHPLLRRPDLLGPRLAGP